MEIYSNLDKKYISVWLTKDEQQHYDRKQLTASLLKNIDDPKFKVVFFLSGNDDLYQNVEELLLRNL